MTFEKGELILTITERNQIYSVMSIMEEIFYNDKITKRLYKNSTEAFRHLDELTSEAFIEGED